jgi:hypothetical protein
MVAIGIAGAAQAQTNVAAGVHNASEHWTLAGSPYRLQGQVYFSNASTLTIDAGVIVASQPAEQGSLAICRGSQIFANGTQAQPVIFTSTNDVATWTGTTGSGSSQIPGDPKTGTWREAVNEWGNVTIMGAAYISENAVGGNTPVPSATNVANMEGLINGPSTDQYGGGQDNDDSGSLSYVSLRYGGKVIGLANELNGLSLGGIGNNTDLDHIDIMNNVDDGVEIWGGTVNLKHVNIWNIGDDSLDIDQGWRGKAQFVLIVQGYSVDASQGSGVGDNCFETDGAEDSSWQPVTTGTIYNATVIGQPVDGDQGTAWRDNARLQYRNCIFTDLGEELIKLDNVDGDGGHGYGFESTLTWADTWSTAYNAVPAHANDFTTGTYAGNYPAQSSGKLAEITDSVFFSNNHASAYTQATALGQLAPAQNNALVAGTNMASWPAGPYAYDSANGPVALLTRGPSVIRGGKVMYPVALLDPHPAHAAVTSVAAAPADGFFTPAMYRGAFAPNAQSWLCEWTASYAFGFTPGCDPGTAGCFPGTNGVTACPCGQPANPAGGCANFGAGSTSGAVLGADGLASVSSDTVILTTSNHRPAAAITNVFFTGSGTLSLGVPHGAGVRCVSTALKRLYTGQAIGGTLSKPGVGDPSITTRSAALSVPILPGQTRHYFNLYRDNQAATPCGNTASTVNTTNSYSIQWSF